MGFYEWLLTQTKRDDLIGDFAEDTRRCNTYTDMYDKPPVESGAKSVWVKYLDWPAFMNPRLMESFNLAWAAWQVAK